MSNPERRDGRSRMRTIQITRRQLCGGASAGVLTISLGGCGLPNGTGIAYETWTDYPDPDLSPELRLVQAGILAASPHNTQPWRFVVSPEQIELWHDADRSLGEQDPLGREVLIGLGCALENLAIAAPGLGRSATIESWPDANHPNLAARISLAPTRSDQHPLAATIVHRHTQRGRYLDAPLTKEVEPTLVDLIDDLQDVELMLLQSADERAAFRDDTIAATQAIVADREMNEASHVWWRQTRDEIERYRDGLTIDAMGFGAATKAFGKLGKGPSAEKAGKYWIKNTKGNQTTGSAFGVLLAGSLDERTILLQVGRAWQRIHLWITANGLGAQPLNQQLERRDREVELGLDPVFGRKLAERVGEHAHLAFRVGYPWELVGPSPRRPVDWVVDP